MTFYLLYEFGFRILLNLMLAEDLKRSFQTSKPEPVPEEQKKTQKKGQTDTDLSEEPEDIPFDPPRHPGGSGYQVPPGIRPILKNTRVEVLSWGLRHLKFWAKKPIDNPLLEIECGGAMLTLPKIPDLVNLPNFPQTSHYFDVVSLKFSATTYFIP